MELGSTVALWGLLGMMVPLIIHLLSKQKQEEILFGSIQFLEETAADKARSIQLSQWPLLIIRMLIIGMLTFLTAQLLTSDHPKKKHQVFLPSAIIEDPNYSSYTSRFNGDEYSINVYTHDRSEESDMTLYIPTLNALVAKANQSTDTVTIASLGYQKDVSGKLLTVGERVTILQVPINDITSTQQRTIRDTSYQVTITEQNENIQLILGEGTHHDVIESIRICFIASSKSQEEKIQLEKLLTALTEHMKYPIEYNCEVADWMITIDTMIQNSIKEINWKTSAGPLNWINDGSGNYSIAGSMNSAGLRATNLPLLMADVLSADQLAIDPLDKRTVKLSDIVVDNEVAIAQAGILEKRDVSSLLWMPLMLLLLGERYLANRDLKTV